MKKKHYFSRRLKLKHKKKMEEKFCWSFDVATVLFFKMDKQIKPNSKV